MPELPSGPLLAGLATAGLLVLCSCASQRSAPPGPAAGAPADRAAAEAPAETPPAPPVAEVSPHVTRIHGLELSDDYHWLRQRGEQKVLDHLEAENRYTEAMMAHTAELQEELYREMLGRIREDDSTAPVRDGGYLYYTRTEEGKPYPIHCRKKGSAEAEEEILLDVNALAEGEEFYEIGVLEMSPDHRKMAYSFDTSGEELYTLVVKDLETGELLPDRIENTYYSVEWANDNRTLFYNILDHAKRPYKIFRHRLGDPVDADPEVFHEPDESFFVGLSKTRSDKYLMIMLGSSTTTEMHYLDADRPQGDFQLFRPRQHEVEYYLDYRGDYFYIRTNEGAKNFKLMRARIDSPGIESWEEVIPHRPEVKLESVDLFRDFVVLVERQAGLRLLRVRPFGDEAEEHYVELPESAYALYPGENPEFDSGSYRFIYTSLITPRTDFDYVVAERRLDVVKREEVLGGYDPALYTTYRVEAAASDGVSVPITLVHARDLARDGSHPCLLYGYGSYGATNDPSFSSLNLSLLERGFVYAIAHVRGGGLLGEEWHDRGKMLEKRNTFTDFVAAAEHLIAAGYTSSDWLAIRGGSAGGLLMGAVINLRPDLFAAVVAHVPFVDVVNTMLDADIPLTVIEFEEWGNPREKEYFDYMISYSPYDNVAAAEYPHMLVTAGLNDPRVQYWEPAKWVAKLRAKKTGENRLLLKTNMGAGHAGPSGRYERLRERAFEFAFLLDVLKID